MISISELEITRTVWDIINTVSGIPSSEIKNDTLLDPHDLKIITQEVGIAFCLPVHGSEFRNIPTVEALMNLILSKKSAVLA